VWLVIEHNFASWIGPATCRHPLFPIISMPFRWESFLIRILSRLEDQMHIGETHSQQDKS
jgi:hypothetical protein